MTTLLAPLPLSLSLSLSSSGLVDQSRRRRRRQICSVSATRRSDERETKRRSTRQQQQQQQQHRRAIFWIRATVSSAGDDYVDGSKDTDDAAADLLQRLDEPITLDARVTIACAVKAIVASGILVRVFALLTTTTTTATAAYASEVKNRWFLLLKSTMLSSMSLSPLLVLVSFAAILALAVLLEKEKKERDRLVSAIEAKDVNSRFADVDGVSVHHKYFTSSSSSVDESGVLFSCAHGFGANTYSYEMGFVDKLLEKNEANNSIGVVCHDSVGFGLTERPRTDLMKYTKVFNAKCLKAMAKKYVGEETKKKVVYVGHSLGTIAATLTTTLKGDEDDATKPAALVLIAPAFLVKKEKEKKKNVEANDGVEEQEQEQEQEVMKKKPIQKKKIIAPDDEFYDEELFNRVVLSSLKAVWGWIKSSLFNLLAKPLLYVLLRRIVRSKKFWQNGLSNVVAKSKTSLVDESWIDGYRRPRVVQNWDLGMINFVSASLNDLGADLKAIFQRHMRIYADKPNEYDVSMNPMDALKKSAWENNIPILIVHGNEDKVVPISNSVNIYNRLTTAPAFEDEEEEKTASASPLTPKPPPVVKFIVMENTGHCPHEEDPETLATVVGDFLREAGLTR
jgi:pimeloyl-ACP methyl ester carboxylesterase